MRYAAAGRFDGDVAVGHTASDQAETILYRLAAAPSRRALLGMEARSGSIVRPLLSVTRAETEAWCRSAGLAFRDDPSNADARFARNRVRAELLPALRQIQDTIFVQSLLASVLAAGALTAVFVCVPGGISSDEYEEVRGVRPVVFV